MQRHLDGMSVSITSSAFLEVPSDAVREQSAELSGLAQVANGIVQTRAVLPC